MKIDEKLSQIFDIEPIDSKKTEVLPATTEADDDSSKTNTDSDFDLARGTLRNLIHKNEAVIDDLVSLARNSEHPRAYEVAGQLIKAQSDIAKDLMGLHKQRKDIDGKTVESNNIKQQNNIVFAGSTADLMKMIANEKQKNIIDNDE